MPSLLSLHQDAGRACCTGLPHRHSIYLLSFGKSRFLASDVEALTMRVVLRGAGDPTDLPFMRSISIRAASRPLSTIGWRTVVSGGFVHADNGRSSKPTTERSSGTRMPAVWAAFMTPIAAMSLMTSTPVGRLAPEGRDSKARTPAPTEMPAVTASGGGA